MRAKPTIAIQSFVIIFFCVFTSKIGLSPVFGKLVLGCFFGLGLGFALGHGAIWWKKVKFGKKRWKKA
jgi:hypothetical protein